MPELAQSPPCRAPLLSCWSCCFPPHPPPWVAKPCQTGLKTKITVHSASLIPILRFVAGGVLNNQLAIVLNNQLAARGINFLRRTLCRSLPIQSDARCSVRLTMFGHAHANSSKRGSFGFSGTPKPRTPKPAFIPSPLRRQYAAIWRAAIWRSREVNLTSVHRHHKAAGVLFIRPPSKPTCPLVRRMPQKTQPAFSPPRANGFKFIARSPRRISA